MKNKLLRIVILSTMIIMYLQVCIFASTLKLNITADKEKIEVGEEVKVIVSWNQDMQAADFSLLYDSNKLEYLGSNLEEDFVNATKGEIKTAWFSIDNTNKTQIEYTFKAIKSGKVNFTTKVNGGFATGNLEIPDSYEEGNLKIKVLGNPIITVIGIIFVLVIIVIVVKKKIKR